MEYYPRNQSKIREEIVSELQMAFEFFRFMWVLLMEVFSTLQIINLQRTTLCNNPSTPLTAKLAAMEQRPVWGVIFLEKLR
jgi:hypothetical protein